MVFTFVYFLFKLFCPNEQTIFLVGDQQKAYLIFFMSQGQKLTIYRKNEGLRNNKMKDVDQKSTLCMTSEIDKDSLTEILVIFHVAVRR